MSELLFEYKVRARHRLGWKEFSFYATTEIEEFLNRNSIDYVRNATDTVESRLFKENKRLNNIINELEKELKEDYKTWICNSRSNGKSVKFGIDVCKTHFYNKLQELKGSE